MPAETDKRASHRIRQQTDLTVVQGDGEIRLRVQMQDYSDHGLLFISPQAFRPGDKLQLTMDHFDPAAQGPEAFRSYAAEVRHCRQMGDADDGRFRIGVCYLTKSREDIPDLIPARQPTISAGTLRKKAERLLDEHPDAVSEIVGANTGQILHELQVHQIELEMQNEELRRAQSETEAALAKYTDLYDFAPVSYFSIDSKGLIQDVNLTGTALLGVARQQLIGKPFGHFVAPEDKDAFWLHRQSIIDSRVRQSIEIKLHRHDGRQVSVSLESSLIPQAEHFNDGLFSVVSDITERKHAEEECRRLEDCLAEAKKMEAIGTLAGGVAHDFNNLLMGIQGYVSIMREDLNQTHPFTGHLDTINNLIRSAAELTRRLLGFAQGGKYDVRPIDVNARIRNSLDLFKRTHRDVHVKTHLPNDLWAVSADRSQIDQVLLNLYINAGDAMPDGGRLEISTANFVLIENPGQPHQLPAGNYVQITIRDTGIGMDQATRERIFEPFYTTKNMGRGTGLGLASVYGIVRNHQGHIQVYSKPLKGSTFVINLPATTADIPIAPRIPLEILSGTETVLLVDDEAQVRAAGAIMLDRLGYHVLLAESGKDALKQFGAHRDQIDLVVLDMTMPGMSGRETYDQLKALHPGVKVLLASGYSQNGAAADILNRGCQGFIQKPYPLTKFSQALRNILDAT